MAMLMPIEHSDIVQAVGEFNSVTTSFGCVHRLSEKRLTFFNTTLKLE